MLRNILYLLFGAIVTILIFSGILAGVARPKPTPASSPAALEAEN